MEDVFMRLAIYIVNWVFLGMVLFCFAYQGYYFLLIWLKRKKKRHVPEVFHRMAVLIAARNEENVIAQLIESIRKQDYPEELIDIYVVADNCEDATAEIAGKNGAKVYERFNLFYIGKGYALRFLTNRMKEDGVLDRYDGYLVFDADNLLDQSYVREINRTFCDGYQIITSCRNTKNFAMNWLTASYGLWFLHEAQWINKGRMLNGTSCGVSGTGFFFSGKIMERMGGWNHVLLTEDIEYIAIRNFTLG